MLTSHEYFSSTTINCNSKIFNMRIQLVKHVFIHARLANHTFLVKRKLKSPYLQLSFRITANLDKQ